MTSGRHLWAVGVDSDFVFELPAEQREHVLTSMLKRLDLGVERIVEDFQAGDLEVPGSLRLGLADEAVGYSTAGDHLSPATIAEVDGLAADIASGAITVSTTPTGDLREPPPAPRRRTRLRAAPRSTWRTATSRPWMPVTSDTAMALLSPTSRSSVFGPWSRRGLRDAPDLGCRGRPAVSSTWTASLACQAAGSRSSAPTACTLGMTRLSRDRSCARSAQLVVHDGAITDLTRTVIPPDYTVVDNPFDTWMQEHHSDDDEVVACCDWPSLDEARQTGALRARYGEEWAAYLEAKGCTFDEGC